MRIIATEEYRIPLMDQYGISMQILSLGGQAIQNNLDEVNDYFHYTLENTMNQLDSCNLTQTQRELIYHGNAERLYGIK